MSYSEDVKKWSEARKASGVSQKEISEKSGISQQMISDFEKGKKRSFPLYFYYKDNFGGMG
jgi:transcriptional regulator with XRE-family HTH domain